MIDECTQDWTLLSAEAGNGSLVFEAERALDTGDTQDRVFADDTQDGEKRAFISRRTVFVCCLTQSTGHCSILCIGHCSIGCDVFERAEQSLAGCAWPRRSHGLTHVQDSSCSCHVHAPLQTAALPLPRPCALSQDAARHSFHPPRILRTSKYLIFFVLRFCRSSIS